MTTDFDLPMTAAAVIFLLPELTFEAIELTTTRHEDFAHAAAVLMDYYLDLKLYYI